MSCFTPTEILEKDIKTSQLIKVGLVVDESIDYKVDGLTVDFVITDTKNIIKVNYKGILPDLFRRSRSCSRTIDKRENFYKIN